MPLPRFSRLPAEQRRAVLDVARRQFAHEGVDTASYNRIIEAAAISKTSAYHYFDGREDLLGAVLDDVRSRAAVVLGDWQPAATADEFWRELRAGGARLYRHLSEDADDRVLIEAARRRDRFDPGEKGHQDPAAAWFGSVLHDGIVLGVIRSDLDPVLMLSVTAAVFQAADRWAIGRLGAGGSGQPGDLEPAWQLLASLWAPAGPAPTTDQGR